jgi:hypothetical protein|tara:strand:+ start:157 stop:408 length:252 start_codon:yes stop_codon:yes gene_type:complete
MSKSVSKTVRVDEMFDEYHEEKYSTHLSNQTKENIEADKKYQMERKVNIARLHVQNQKLVMINKLGLVKGPLQCLIILEVIRI